jgi:hypothetical protein
MAQVYPRIANPYMYQGTPNLTNAPTPILAPGEIGCAFNDQNTGNAYVRVLVDSGATSATPVGAILAGQVAYWKNQTGGAGSGQATVTNDPRFCDLGPVAAPNRIAGIFQLSPTVSPGVTGPDGNPQLYVTDLVIQGRGVPVLCSSTPTAGEYATGNTSANTANCVATAIGTAPPTQPVGIWTGTANTGVANSFLCDVNIGFID